MKNLAIIIPYRDREKHLFEFVPHIKKFLSTKKNNYKIIVVEQNNDKLFNRAKLLNVGFALSKENFDYFCMHDIDMLPEDEKCDYSYVEGVSRLSTYVSQFDYIERPNEEIGGGIMLIDKDSFIKVNGYSNMYWGWGAEDNDFGERLKREKIPYEKRYGRYKSLSHKKSEHEDSGKVKQCVLDNRKLLQNKILDKNSHKNDGLNTLQFTLEETIDFQDFVLHKVGI